MSAYGWLPDLPDHRDHVYDIAWIGGFPNLVDLRGQCPPVYDQGQLGSCTANAIAGAYEFDQMKQRRAAFVPSRLFIYYNERVIEHTVKTDSGAMLRDGIKTVAKQGVCPETIWPYDIKKFTRKPPVLAYSTATKNQALTYKRLAGLNSMLGCLASGLPFVFGFTVYESFESREVAQSGIVPMPKRSERALGGHAVMAVGYSQPEQRFICRNSWGNGWGQNGYFTMPYGYVDNPNLADDFWVIQTVE